MQIVDMHPLLHRPQADLVGRADRDPSRHSAAGHPHREAGGIVVAAVSLLAHRSPSKLTTPDHECRIEQPATTEVLDERRNRLVHLPAEIGVAFLELRVAVPLAACAVIELHEPHAPLHQSAGEQAVATKRRGLLLIQPVEPLRLRRLLVKVHR